MGTWRAWVEMFGVMTLPDLLARGDAKTRFERAYRRIKNLKLMRCRRRQRAPCYEAGNQAQQAPR